MTLSENGPDGAVVLRPLRRRDANEWTALRTSNQAWLDRWEATAPLGSGITSTFGEYVRTLGRQARSGTSLPFVVEYRGEIAGQITVSSIMYGSLRSASIGYWIAQSVAGRGITPTAVALVTDHCFQVLGLHRMEVNIRPENGPSLRVVEKLGFRDEGVRERFLHIQGGWRDHRTFALTVEDVPDGLLPRWRRLRNGL